MHKRADLDLRELEIFLCVCELRGMTAAARRLGLTQPAVSAAVKQLEEKLATPLMDRGKRPLVPTVAGHWLADVASQVVSETRQIPIAIRHLNRGAVLRLRVGLITSLSYPFAPILVRRLKASVEYLSVSSGLAHSLRQGLIERSLDLIITNDPLEGVNGLAHRTILQEPYMLILPRRVQPRFAAQPLREILKTLPLIRWSAHSNIGSQIELHLRRMGVSAPSRYEFESSGSVIGMVASGLGCAIGTPLLLSDATQVLDKVAVVPFPGPSFSRRIDLVTRSGEIDALADRIAGMAIRILREHYLPFMHRIAPDRGSPIAFGDEIGGS